MDKIHIRDLALKCIIGVYEREREARQDVLINITLHADLRRAGVTDDFHDTIDYKAVKQRVLALVEGSSFQLIEALAEAIASACLEFDGVEQVDVLVEKPGALRYARTVGVEITRARDAGLSTMPTVYIGVGSNIDPEANIPAAIKLLAGRVKVIAVSTFIPRPPIGCPDSPRLHQRSDCHRDRYPTARFEAFLLRADRGFARKSQNRRQIRPKNDRS